MLTLLTFVALRKVPAATTTDSLAAAYLQYGAVAITAIGFGVVLWRVFERAQKRADEAYDREKQRADSAESKYDALQTVMRTEVVPVLTKATDAQARMMDALPEIVAMLRQRER